MADAHHELAENVELLPPDDQESANNVEAAPSKTALIQAPTLIFSRAHKQANKDSLSEEKSQTPTSQPRHQDTRKRPAACRRQTPGKKAATLKKPKRVTMAAISKRTSISTATQTGEVQ
ncbi:hypothetical protein MRX96_040570 [Rhipicephalus microplus]